MIKPTDLKEDISASLMDAMLVLQSGAPRTELR